MILTERIITVNGNISTLDAPIYLYQGDKNVDIYFSIVNPKYKFSKKVVDNLLGETAAYFDLYIIKPDGSQVSFKNQAIEDKKAKWTIESELIDEEIEIGKYDFQIRLLDEDKTSILTIPPLLGQLEILKPIYTDSDTPSNNLVNVAATNYALATSGNNDVVIFDEDGNYVATVWTDKMKITDTLLNKIETAIKQNTAQYKDIANKKIDNVTLSNNILTFFANSKTIKAITLPIPTTGGGTNGKEIELQKSTTHIQWRYVGDTEWTNLVALADLKGSKGDKGEQGIQGVKGDKGDTGATPNLQIGKITTLDSGSNATASITGTVENPLLNLEIPKGLKGDKGDTGLSAGGTLVTTNISGTTLVLTTDKYQTATVVDGTEITLPTVTSFVEIHLFFNTTTDLTITLPACKWQNANTPTISANKAYEFIFTYTTEWLGGVIVYE